MPKIRREPQSLRHRTVATVAIGCRVVKLSDLTQCFLKLLETLLGTELLGLPAAGLA